MTQQSWEGENATRFLPQIEEYLTQVNFELRTMATIKTNELAKTPLLIKTENKYYIWGYKENKWQLTEINASDIPVFEWKERGTLYISPKERIFKTFKQAHTRPSLTQEKLQSLAPNNISRLLDFLVLPIGNMQDFCEPFLTAYRNGHLESFLFNKFLPSFAPLLLNDTFTDVNDTVGNHIHYELIIASNMPEDRQTLGGKFLYTKEDKTLFYVHKNGSLEKITLSSNQNFLDSINDGTQNNLEKMTLSYTKISKTIVKNGGEMPPIMNDLSKFVFSAFISWLGQMISNEFLLEPNKPSCREYMELVFTLNCYASIDVQGVKSPTLNRDWITYETAKAQVEDIKKFLEEFKEKNDLVKTIYDLIEDLQTRPIDNKRELGVSDQYTRYFLLRNLHLIENKLREIQENPAADAIKAYLLRQKKQQAQAFLKFGGNKASLYVPGRPESSIFTDDEFHSLLKEKLSEADAQNKINVLIEGLDSCITALNTSETLVKRIISMYSMDKNARQYQEQKITSEDFNKYYQNPTPPLTCEDFLQLSHQCIEESKHATTDDKALNAKNRGKQFALMALKTILQDTSKESHERLSQFMKQQYEVRELLELPKFTWWQVFLNYINQLVTGETNPEIQLSKAHEKIIALAARRDSFFSKPGAKNFKSEGQEKEEETNTYRKP